MSALTAEKDISHHEVNFCEKQQHEHDFCPFYEKTVID